jgi:hypothetical protein
MAGDNDSRSSYRCVIPAEVGAAKLKINGTLVECRVTDASRDAFGICISNKYARKLLGRKPRLELYFRSERWRVSVHSHYQETDTLLNVGLDRVCELTKPRLPSGFGGICGTAQVSLASDPSFLLALMVAFLLTCICLPGIGDSLGTAPRVREGVNNMVRYVTQAIR